MVSGQKFVLLFAVAIFGNAISKDQMRDMLHSQQNAIQTSPLAASHNYHVKHSVCKSLCFMITHINSGSAHGTFGYFLQCSSPEN